VRTLRKEPVEKGRGRGEGGEGVGWARRRRGRRHTLSKEI